MLARVEADGGPFCCSDKITWVGCTRLGLTQFAGQPDYAA